MYFTQMKATITDLHRRAADLMQRVDAGEIVELTRHGEDVAQIIPLPKARSGRELSGLLQNAPRLGVDVAEDVAKTLKELDAAT